MTLLPSHFVLMFLIAAVGVAGGLGYGLLVGTRRGRAAGTAAMQQAAAERQALEGRWSSERATFAAREAALLARGEEHEHTSERLQRELDACEAHEQAVSARLHEVELELARQRVHASEAQRAADERMQLLSDAREQLRSEFRQLSQQIFTEKTERLDEHSQKLVAGVLQPLREQLGDFRKKIEDVYEKEVRDRVQLLTQIEQLHRHNQTLSQQALHLTQALKGQSKVRGMWGEQTLETLLEVSGLVKGVEYQTQKSFKTEDGSRRQPDVIINLPDHRQVVIDAKVSLNDYLAYCEAEDEQVRQDAARAHVGSLRGHVNDLATKDYAGLLGSGVVDFVLLFVPIEPALLVALQQDPELFSSAYRRKIIVVGSTTLLATLRTIEGIWRFERQSKNAEEIARQAGELWDHMARTLDSLEAVGKQIEGAQVHFDETIRRLATGRGNLRRRAEALRQLGVKGKKELPAALLSRLAAAEEEEAAEDAAVHSLTARS
jgi:DNA recombination protein RmuC